jgi:threonine/homoserine/homoserine lactone efflux protein
MESLPGFIFAGIALIGSLGPATMSIAAAGAAFGRRRSFVYMLGIIVGLVIVMVLTASGVGAALWALPGTAPLITLAAAG